MPAPKARLGDSHNFGRRVTLEGDRVVKPRTLFWEQLLLSPQSPLRRLLADVAERDGLGRDAFEFLPSLRFFPAKSGVGGKVEHVRLEPLPRKSRKLAQELATTFGRSLALWSWLGAADLHWENLVLGVDERGRIIFGPLDIEMLLADLSLPTETKLLPDADPEYAELCRHAAGVRRVLPVLGKPITAEHLLGMAAAYRSTLALLERHASAIGKLLHRLPGLREAPIRVLLRSTSDYVSQGSPELWPPLLEAEAEQLARGDIPYFFRLYGKKGIHYYTSRNLSQVGRLPLAGDMPQLEPLLELARGCRSPSRRKLSQDGFFALLGAFDDLSLTGTQEHAAMQVRFGQRTLSVKFADGEALSTSRDLRAFVGSVYLPCRCGEVRTVLVPPVSRCSAR
jgi:hypothetical protein